jgi:hypothetical protein
VFVEYSDVLLASGALREVDELELDINHVAICEQIFPHPTRPSVPAGEHKHDHNISPSLRPTDNVSNHPVARKEAVLGGHQCKKILGMEQ